MVVPRVCLIGFKKGGLDGAEFMVVVPRVCFIGSIMADCMAHVARGAEET
jgi:hypothetical protein